MQGVVIMRDPYNGRYEPGFLARCHSYPALDFIQCYFKSPPTHHQSQQFEVQKQVTKMRFYLAGAFGNTLNLLPVVYKCISISGSSLCALSDTEETDIGPS